MQPSALIKAPSDEEAYWTLRAADGAETLLAAGSLVPQTSNAWLLGTLQWLRELHVDLFAGVVGETVLLLCALAGVVLAFTGVIIWWPARRGFRWRYVVPRPMPARLMRLGHRHTGALAAGVILLLLLSAALMLWQMLLQPLLSPASVNTIALPAAAQRGARPSQWLQLALTQVPDGEPTFIRLPQPNRNEVSIRLRLPGEWHINGRTAVTLDFARGQLSVGERSDRAAAARRLLNQLYPLHSGYGMVGFYSALVFTGGIALSWLGITGLGSYCGRRR